MIRKAYFNKHFVFGSLFLIIIVASIYAYFRYNNLYPSTNNAYINAKLVNVAPKVTGYLQTLTVTNNQRVHKGDMLFTIEPTDYNFAVQEQQKSYDSQLTQSIAAKKQVDIQQQQMIKDQEQYALILDTAERYKKLYKANTISTQNYKTAMTNLASIKTQLAIDNKKLQQMQDIYKITLAKKDQSKIAVDNAKSNLDYTHYMAPVDGYITNLNALNTGEFINAGQQLFAIVDDNDWWVDANFKETQLQRIKVGQMATVTLDMYPTHTFTGTVQSISYASGNTFSLLPAQNATGNWVKVTQRFTIHIKIKNDGNYPLRVGASANVKITTV